MLQNVILSRPLWQKWLLPQRQEEGYNVAKPKGQALSLLSLKKQPHVVHEWVSAGCRKAAGEVMHISSDRKVSNKHGSSAQLCCRCIEHLPICLLLRICAAFMVKQLQNAVMVLSQCWPVAHADKDNMLALQETVHVPFVGSIQCTR